MTARGPSQRVVLLDPFASTDGFIGDDRVVDLAQALNDAGVDVQLVRVTGVAPQDARIASRLRAGAAPTLLVVTRAWSEPLVSWLRTLVAPSTLVVRLRTHTAVSPIDGAFDRVLDPGGVIALATGQPPEQPRAPGAARTADQKRRLRLEGAERAARARAASPSDPARADDAGAHPRPTLSGPASGCPYLADAREISIFASLPADTVQVRGCTFCLDQSGAWVAPSEADVLATWLARLRTIRARDANAREVLLTDERPHPWLPALFRALRDEPALHGIELLVKSRVDWLLEFGESHLAPAAELAAETASVLHVYLVGFENFDPFHLELFNKGQTPEDNAAAIEVLRSLARRYPASFEFRRLRAHGIVLFTPWTTPEALRDNARWMARVGFGELRSEALRTRLRLYPGTALHHLAAEHGLLAERFEDARTDRAVEQGYDASVPWRFSDPRAEAVFRIASALAVGKVYDESDVLAAASELVLAHPALADVADDAALALKVALGPWRDWRALAGTGVLGLDLELEALQTGRKRAMLKENVSARDAPGLVRAYRAMGLYAEIASTHDRDATDTHRAGDADAIVAVATSRAMLDELLRWQRALGRERGHDDVAALGDAMGYPACCVSAFLAQRERGDNTDNERRVFLRAPDATLHPLLNRVGPFPLLSHHVCTPDCAASIALAESALESVRRRSAEAARRIEVAARRAALFLDYRRTLDLEGTFDGADFVVSWASEEAERIVGESLARAVRLRVFPSRVELRFADGRLRAIDVPRPLLVVPGSPLAPSALEAIAPVPERAAVALPPLHPAIRVGVRVVDYRIERVTRGAAGWVLELARPADRFQAILSPRTHAPGELSGGAFRLEAGSVGGLDGPRRAALSTIARVLDSAARAEAARGSHDT